MCVLKCTHVYTLVNRHNIAIITRNFYQPPELKTETLSNKRRQLHIYFNYALKITKI